MSGKMPFIQLYVDDWMSDVHLAKCTPSTRGIWVDAICAMHKDGRSGILSGTVDELARICRCSQNEMQLAIENLTTHNAADVRQRNGLVTLVNRRMRREAKSRQQSNLRQGRRRGAGAASRSRHAAVTPHQSESRIQNPESIDQISQRADFFQGLTKTDLCDAAKMLGVFPLAVSAGHVGDSENDRINFVAAGYRAFRLGKRSPIGLFRTIVTKAKWADLSEADVDSANAAIKAARSVDRTHGRYAPALQRTEGER